jgi:hypothetical protein
VFQELRLRGAGKWPETKGHCENLRRWERVDLRTVTDDELSKNRESPEPAGAVRAAAHSRGCRADNRPFDRDLSAVEISEARHPVPETEPQRRPISTG